VSKSALAAKVGLAPSSCLERLRKLERTKMIISYSAHINVRILAAYELFFTEISLRSHRSHDFNIFENYVKRVSAIVECYALGGGIDYILKIAARNVEGYQNLLDEMLVAEIGIEKYFTYICTKPVKARSSVPIEAVLGTMHGHD